MGRKGEFGIREDKKERINVMNKIKELRIKNFIILAIAGVINATGVTLFLAPLNLFDSGFSGTSFLLDQLTPAFLTLSIFLIILNVPFYLFGYKRLGFTFVVYSIFAICIYSGFAFLFRNVFPIDFSNGSPIVDNDFLLAAIFGGLLSGIGSGLVIRYGGAIDGVEVMAVIFAKKVGITVGVFVMAYNVVLYVISALIFGSWLIPLYSIIAYTVGIKAVDFIVEGIDKAKSAYIITCNADAVCKELSEKLGRGLTILDAKGYYHDVDKKLIYCVINRFEISKLKRIIQQVDPKAYVTINEVSDILKSEI